MMGIVHPPLDFKNEEEIFRYDQKKPLLEIGERRVLVFNLLNFIPMLLKGEYSMKFFLRIAGTFGYDQNGNIITNSVSYLESKMMNFEIRKTINTPNKIH